MWLGGLVRSFRNAFRGFFRAVREERNLRTELVCACYAVGFGFAAELSPGQWGAVLLCCGLVIAAELFNTALENLCDAVCPTHNPKIGAAKDMSAAAVQALAFASVGVGWAVFYPWFLYALSQHFLDFWPVLASLPFAILWIRGKKTWK